MTHLDDGADLRATMERSMRDLHAPDHCGPAAVGTGRRIRRRRRAMGAVSGVAACAAVTAVFAIPALGEGGGATPGAPAASDVTTPTPTPAPTPTDAQTPSKGPDEVPDLGAEGPAGWWSMPSARMVDVLAATLPEGVTVTRADTTSEGPDGPSPAIGGLSGTLDAGAGPGAFQILLVQPGLDPIPDPVTTTDAAGNEDTSALASAAALQSRIRCRPVHDTCEQIRNAAGEQIGRVSTNVERGTLLYEVSMLGPDGGALNFTVMNSTGEKPGYEEPSAEVPPLSPDQLRALAEDPVWTSYRP